MFHTAINWRSASVGVSRMGTLSRLGGHPSFLVTLVPAFKDLLLPLSFRATAPHHSQLEASLLEAVFTSYYD